MNTNNIRLLADKLSSDQYDILGQFGRDVSSTLRATADYIDLQDELIEKYEIANEHRQDGYNGED